MKMPRVPSRTFFALLLAAPLLAAAAPPAAPNSRAQLEIETTLASLNERGLLAAESGQPSEWTAPPRERLELGAVLDLGAEGPGLPVLAVTPGAAAERLGLAVGDRIVAINGRALPGTSDVAAGLAAAVAADDGTLAVSVERLGQTLELRGEADSVAVPGYQLRIDGGPAPGSTCATVTLQWLDVPADNLHPVFLSAINGGGAPNSENTRFRLAPGTVTLKLFEMISPNRFTGGQRLERQRLARMKKNFQNLALHLEPGYDYRIAARLVPDNVDSIRDNGYWKAAVVQRSALSCGGGGIRVAPLGR